MVDKTVSEAELRALAKGGANIKLGPDSMEIEQFDELLKTLKKIAENESERIRADIARNQTNLEVLATLQAMIRKQGEGPKAHPDVDLTPLVAMIEELREERLARDQATYKFDIKRDGRGFAQEILATPIKPTIN